MHNNPAPHRRRPLYSQGACVAAADARSSDGTTPDKLSGLVKSIKLTPRKRGWWIGRRRAQRRRARQTGRRSHGKYGRCLVVGRRLNAPVRSDVNPGETSSTTTMRTTTTTTSSSRLSGNCVAPVHERDLTLSPPIPARLYTLPYWSNPPFLIFDIRALWHSGLSARAPQCQKLKMIG